MPVNCYYFYFNFKALDVKFKLICHGEEWSLTCLKSHFSDIVRVRINKLLCVSGSAMYQIFVYQEAKY